MVDARHCTIALLFGAAFALAAVSSEPASATTANDLCAAGADPCLVSTAVAVTDLSVIDVGARELRITSGGSLDVGSGSMTVRAGRLTVEGGGALRALGSSSVIGGIIDAAADEISIDGTVDASGSEGGQASLDATGSVTINGTIKAQALTVDETGGEISLTGGDIAVNANIDASTRAGGEASLGGDITIVAEGDLTISATLDVSGGDGGEIDVTAGGVSGTGNLTLTETGRVVANATTAGGFGGEIGLDATGEGGETGNIFVDGTIAADGRGGTEDTGGGTGGGIDLTASGDLRCGAASSMSVRGARPDGDGGDIDFTTILGAAVSAGVLDAGSDGGDSSGGGIDLDINTDILVQGKILSIAGSGGGGETTIESTEGSVSVDETAVIDVSGTSDGSGGSVCIASSLIPAENASSTVSVRGPIRADGNGAGTGGSVEFDGTDFVQLSAPISANGGNAADGGAVAVQVDSGPALLESAIDASGSGSLALGGVLSVDADMRISVSGDVDLTGGMKGGMAGFASSGPVSLLGNIEAGSPGEGGSVEVTSEGDVVVGGTLTTNGGANVGGRIEMLGCFLIVCGLNNSNCPAGTTGILNSLGPNGVNRLTGRGRNEAAPGQEPVTVVIGNMRADSSSGRNELVYDGDALRQPVVLGSIQPRETLVVDASLQPCPTCGNSVIEAPETCDDGNQEDGDGCSAICQLETVVRGDVNGDRHVDGQDSDDLVMEIFDGDGDGVGTVSSPIGTFPGNPGADANADTRINAADFTAIIQIIAGP